MHGRRAVAKLALLGFHTTICVHVVALEYIFKVVLCMSRSMLYAVSRVPANLSVYKFNYYYCHMQEGAGTSYRLHKSTVFYMDLLALYNA